MMPRPPAPTLFPYTTLFRSEAVELDERARIEQHVEPLARRHLPFLMLGSDTIGTTTLLGLGTLLLQELDRKSTRLNSSHTVISYAVFCLKKKNRKRPRNTTE